LATPDEVVVKPPENYASRRNRLNQAEEGCSRIHVIFDGIEVLGNNATPFEHKRRNRENQGRYSLLCFSPILIFAYVVVNEMLIRLQMVSRHPEVKSNREL